ncbi:MAG: YggS family pyridoxal phosphate-dependent enzyme [Desulfotignum sp.]|nr:YggS family pyridoxal phosphate-dependent enzyme [Desulfotignum sp.]MCF8125366.1 YggS family pyridoxal phosphate-dependent enzyme [Desulfotignum sp.]
MTTIKENLTAIREKIIKTAVSCGRNPDDIQLVGVSKKKPVQQMQQALDAGLHNLGENYIQEAVEKIDHLGRESACWHFIGHLQSNKARFAVRYFDFIHTVDKLKLAREIDKQAKKIQKRQKILLQVNIAGEETKSGATRDRAVALAKEIMGFENLELSGLMCMPPYFDDPEDARIYFKQLVRIRQDVLASGVDDGAMAELSMGMSHDFEVAIQEGATMVRVGTAIFGSRT